MAALTPEQIAKVSAWVAEGATLILTCTKLLAMTLAQELGFPSERMATLYHGIDPARVEVTRSPEDPPVILAVGRLVGKKGLAHLVSACGILAYVDKDTLEIRKIEGNPVHPGSRGRTCAKGVVTPNQLHDPDRILYPMRRKGARGSGEWERVSWDQVLEDLGARLRQAMLDGRKEEVMYHVGRPGEDG